MNGLTERNVLYIYTCKRLSDVAAKIDTFLENYM